MKYQTTDIINIYGLSRPSAMPGDGEYWHFLCKIYQVPDVLVVGRTVHQRWLYNAISQPTLFNNLFSTQFCIGIWIFSDRKYCSRTEKNYSGNICILCSLNNIFSRPDIVLLEVFFI
jgi:hypothetical protein